MKNKTLESRRIFKSALDAACSYLVGVGMIESDADIVSAANVNKGNFSSMKTGAMKTTKNIVLFFQTQYNLDLQDFDPETYRLEDYILKRETGPSRVPVHLLTQLEDDAKRLLASLAEIKSAQPYAIHPGTGADLASAQTENSSDKKKTSGKPIGKSH